jgi:hypothetical protein
VGRELVLHFAPNTGSSGLFAPLSAGSSCPLRFPLSLGRGLRPALPFDRMSPLNIIRAGVRWGFYRTVAVDEETRCFLEITLL